MSGSLNKVILIGNLGADPEIRSMPSGGSIANLSLATNESWTDRDGQKQTRTEWHRVSVFGKLADVCGQYLKRGSKVLVEGQLRTRKWQDDSGSDRYTTEVILSGYASNMQMLDSVGNNDGEASAYVGGFQRNSHRNNEQSGSKVGISGGHPNDNTALHGSSKATAHAGGGSDFDDDIPF